MKTIKLSALLISITMLSSCSYRMIDFTVISSKNVNLNVPKEAKSTTRVVGKSSAPVIIIHFTASLKEAVDNAIESAGTDYDALIDGVVYQYDYSFFFGVWGYRVEGTAIKTSELKAMLGDGDFEKWGMNHNIEYHSKN